MQAEQNSKSGQRHWERVLELGFEPRQSGFDIY